MLELALRADRALLARQPVLDLAPQEAVVVDRLLGAAERREDGADVVHPAEVGVDRGRPRAAALEHPDEVLLGAGRALEQLLQAILVVAPAGDLLQRRDHHLLELRHHVVPHLRGGPPLALVGHMQHGDRRVVLLPQDLEPLEEREAAGVAQEQQVRLRHPIAGGPDVAALHHPEVALDVGADVLRVAELLRPGDVVRGAPAHGRLQGVDLGQDRQHVEGQEQLREIAGHEGVCDLLPALPGLRQPGVVRRQHLLLADHARLLLDGVAHASLHSLMESAKVPACSRITWNCPPFSEYLKEV